MVGGERKCSVRRLRPPSNDKVLLNSLILTMLLLFRGFYLLL